jgi:lysine 2,3-aminomutase
MVSQSVLLRGVNDDAATLEALMRALRGRVSGLCQPEYVLDIPGGHGKAPVGPDYLSRANLSREREHHGESRYRIVDYCGDVHLYPPSP